MKNKQYTDKDVIDAVKNEYSFRGVLKRLKLKTDSGGNHTHLQQEIKRLNLDISHFTGKAYLKGKSNTFTKPKYTLNDLLTKNSNHSRTNIKRRILNNKILKNVCSICGLKPTWMDKNLNLVLDHINGINNDYRIENLRLICPNCNSQLDTFCGKNRLNKYKNRINPDKICKCGKIKNHGSKKCWDCSVKIDRKREKINIRKFNPTKCELENLILKYPYTEIAKKFNVSDNSIKKRAIKLGIKLENRLGFWSKYAGMA